MPSIGIDKEYVEAGGLLSYGVDGWSQILHSLELVDRILRGARPVDVPIELPTRFHLAINLRTAREIGVTVPMAVQARADHLIT